MLATTP